MSYYSGEEIEKIRAAMQTNIHCNPKQDALDILNAFTQRIENDVIQIDNVIMKTSTDKIVIELVRKDT